MQFPLCAATLAAHFLDTLLAGHGLARPLSGAGVGPSPLAADRQAAAVAQAAVATDLLEALDVLVQLPAERALDRVVLVQDRRNAGDVLVGQLARPPLRI